MKQIKTLTLQTVVKYKYSKEKRNRELKRLKKFVKDSDLFIGQKRKIYKFINSFIK